MKDFPWNRGKPFVSHLQFVDDAIIFCDNSHRQIRMLLCVLECFEVVSGLHLNLAKSSLIALGEVSNLNQLAIDLECRMDHLPTTYLGLPLSASYKQVWCPMIDRMRKHLNG